MTVTKHTPYRVPQRKEKRRLADRNGFKPVLPKRPEPASYIELTNGLDHQGLSYQRVKCPYCPNTYNSQRIHLMQSHLEKRHQVEWRN